MNQSEALYYKMDDRYENNANIKAAWLDTLKLKIESPMSSP